MSEKKKLNEEELEKVTGGVQVGDTRIIKCQTCGCEFDPDTTHQGPNVVIPNEDGNGESSYATWFCPVCQSYERYTVVQIKIEDSGIDIPLFII